MSSRFRSYEYPSFGAGGHRAASVGKPFSVLTRRTRPGPGGSNLSLDVQRSRGCGYESRFCRALRSLGVEPLWLTAPLTVKRFHSFPASCIRRPRVQHTSTGERRFQQRKTRRDDSFASPGTLFFSRRAKLGGFYCDGVLQHQRRWMAVSENQLHICLFEPAAETELSSGSKLLQVCPQSLKSLVCVFASW